MLADVVYDTSIIPSLVNVLQRLLHVQAASDEEVDTAIRSPPVAYVASTIRNEETYKSFLHALGMFVLKPAQNDCSASVFLCNLRGFGIEEKQGREC